MIPESRVVHPDCIHGIDDVRALQAKQTLGVTGSASCTSGLLLLGKRMRSVTCYGTTTDIAPSTGPGWDAKMEPGLDTAYNHNS